MFRAPPRAGPSVPSSGASSSSGAFGDATHLRDRAAEVEARQLCGWACAMVGTSVADLSQHPDPTSAVHFRDGRLAVELMHRLLRAEIQQRLRRPSSETETEHVKSLDDIRHVRHLRRHATPAERWQAAVEAVTERNRALEGTREASLMHVRAKIAPPRELCLGLPHVVAPFLFVVFHCFVVRPRLPLVPAVAGWYRDVCRATFDEEDSRLVALDAMAQTGTGHTGGHMENEQAEQQRAWYAPQPSVSPRTGSIQLATTTSAVASSSGTPAGGGTVDGPSALTAAFGDGVLLLLALRGASIVDAAETACDAIVDETHKAGDDEQAAVLNPAEVFARLSYENDVAPHVIELDTCYSAPYLLTLGASQPPKAADGSETSTAEFVQHRRQIIAANAALLFPALDHYELNPFFASASDFLTVVDADAQEGARFSTMLFMLAFAVFERFADYLIPSFTRRLMSSGHCGLPVAGFADDDAYPPLQPPRVVVDADMDAASGMGASPLSTSAAAVTKDKTADSNNKKPADFILELSPDGRAEGPAAPARRGGERGVDGADSVSAARPPKEGSSATPRGDGDALSGGSAAAPSRSNDNDGAGHEEEDPDAAAAAAASPPQEQQEHDDLGIGELPCSLLLSASVTERRSSAAAAAGSEGAASSSATTSVVLASAAASLDVVDGDPSLAFLVVGPAASDSDDGRAPPRIGMPTRRITTDFCIPVLDCVRKVELSTGSFKPSVGSGGGTAAEVAAGGDGSRRPVAPVSAPPASVVTLHLRTGRDAVPSALAELPPPYSSGSEPAVLLRFTNADDAVILHAALGRLLG